MSNLSILDRNILFGMSEPAQDFYLDQRDRMGPLSAEKAALEWDFINSFLNKSLPDAADGYADQGINVAPEALESVRDFIRTRQINRGEAGR